MEQMGVMCEGEWASLSGMYATNEESEFMSQLIGEFSPANVLGGDCLGLLGVQSNFWNGHSNANAASGVNDHSFVCSSDPSSNVCISSQETSTYSGSDGDGDITNLLIGSSQEAYCLLGDSIHSFATNDISCYYNSVDFGFEDENVSSTTYVSTDFVMQLNKDSDKPKNNTKAEAEDAENLYHTAAYQDTKIEIQLLDGTNPPADSKKRPRNFEAPKNKRNVKPRKAKQGSEVTNVDEDKNSCELLMQTTISKCPKDDASAAS